MSELGHKQTLLAVDAMSALHQDGLSIHEFIDTVP
jgi:hypothetical protein